MAKQVEDFDANLAGEEGKTEETKTSWFKRIRKGYHTSTSEKKETPEGLWTKCPECNFICTINELKENLFVCPKMQLSSPHWQRRILLRFYLMTTSSPNCLKISAPKIIWNSPT